MAESDDTPPRPRRRRARAQPAPAAEPSAEPAATAGDTPPPPRPPRRRSGAKPPPEPAPVLPAEPDAGAADSGPVVHAPEPEAPPSGRRIPVRAIGSWVLAVLAAVAIAASVLAVWVHETVLDTDRFMEVVSPAIESDEVKAATADYLSNQVIAALDMQARVEAALTAVDDRLAEGIAEALDLTPQQAQRLQRFDVDLARLAGPIAAGTESRVRDAIATIVSDPRTSELLLGITQVAHERTVLLVRGELEQLPNVVVDEGEVRLNLVPMIAEVLRQLVRQGVQLLGISAELPQIAADVDPGAAIQRLASALGTDLDPDFGQVPLTSTERLEEIQDLVRLVDLLVWGLVIIAIGLAVAAVFTAPSIGAGVVRVAIGGSIGLIVGLLAVYGISAGLASAIESGTARGAFQEIAGAIVGNLQPVLIALAIVGFLAAGAALLADRGSSTPAESGS